MTIDLTQDSVQTDIQAIVVDADADTLVGIEQLDKYTLLTLQTIWRQLYARRAAPHLKTLLIRVIAYRLQAKEYGDVDQHSLSILQTAKTNSIRAQSNKSNNHKLDDRHKPITPKASNALAEGTMLKRQFNGRLYEVTVVNRDGKRCFLLNGSVYKSLSRVAKIITAAHWSGPRFFGLTKLKGKQ